MLPEYRREHRHVGQRKVLGAVRHLDGERGTQSGLIEAGKTVPGVGGLELGDGQPSGNL